MSESPPCFPTTSWLFAICESEALESGLMAYSRPTKQASSLHVIRRAHSNISLQGVEQFEHWFECLLPGETLVYFVGDLATAREATAQVDWIADRAIKLPNQARTESALPI